MIAYDYHSDRATIPLTKISEKDIGYGSLSLFCQHRDAEEDLIVPGAPANKDGSPLTAPAWTDGKSRIYYGPSFEKFTLDEKMAVCCHEILHIALRHISRARNLMKRFGRDYDNFLFNIATDAIINQTLLLSGAKLPRPCVVLSELFETVFGEKIEPEDAIGEWDSEEVYMRLVQLKQSSGCGSEQSETQWKLLSKYAEDCEFAEDFELADGTDSESSIEDMQWQQRFEAAITQSSMRARGAGIQLGKVGHKLKDIPKSRTPWEQELRGIITKAVTRQPRLSFERPTKRFLAMDAYARQTGMRAPAYEIGVIHRHDIPRVVICVDSSGSISDFLLKRFAGEIAGIGRRTGAEIHILVFDTSVISRSKMQGQNWETEITNVEFTRGGGTSFVEVIEEAKTLDPSAIVVLTDLCGPFGKAPGKTPVVWAVPGRIPEAKPDFGRIMSLAA